MAKEKDISCKESNSLGNQKKTKRSDGLFSVGGMPGPGRPKGSFKSPLPYIKAETHEKAAEIISQKVFEGDMSVCMHLCPKPAAPTPEPTYFTDTFEIGPTETPDQMMKALSRLRQACSKGEVSKEYASYLENSMLATYKVYEASELMPTLKAIQEYIKKAGKK